MMFLMMWYSWQDSSFAENEEPEKSLEIYLRAVKGPCPYHDTRLLTEYIGFQAAQLITNDYALRAADIACFDFALDFGA